MPEPTPLDVHFELLRLVRSPVREYRQLGEKLTAVAVRPLSAYTSRLIQNVLRTF